MSNSNLRSLIVLHTQCREKFRNVQDHIPFEIYRPTHTRPDSSWIWNMTLHCFSLDGKDSQTSPLSQVALKPRGRKPVAVQDKFRHGHGISFLKQGLRSR